MSNATFWRVSWKRSRDPNFKFYHREKDSDPSFQCVFGTKRRAQFLLSDLQKDKGCYHIEMLEIIPRSLEISMLEND